MRAQRACECIAASKPLGAQSGNRVAEHASNHPTKQSAQQMGATQLSQAGEPVVLPGEYERAAPSLGSGELLPDGACFDDRVLSAAWLERAHLAATSQLGDWLVVVPVQMHMLVVAPLLTVTRSKLGRLTPGVVVSHH